MYPANRKSPLLILLLITLVSIIGCIPSEGSLNQATQTAQAERAISMATQMAKTLEATYEVQNAKTLATAQALEQQFQASLEWPEYFFDSFEQASNGWPTGRQEDVLANIQWDYTDGKYRWSAQANQAFVWWAIPEMDPIEQFTISLGAQQVRGPDSAEYGIIFRRTIDDEYYLFEISELGVFSVYVFQNGEWEALIDWTETATIHPGEQNQMAITALQSHFYFYINDELVAELEDDRLSSGQVGLLIGLFEEGDEGEWLFNDFEVRAP